MRLKKGILTITLLSDACISTGETFNASIDTDICYDRWGLPYIPGKRIKGCMKEAGLELQDWGINIDLASIFGKEGGQASALTVSNAGLKDYQDYRNAIISNKGQEYTEQQNVLAHFTGLRSQTRISAATGVADPHSLRTVRTINKGLVFQADLIIKDDSAEGTYADQVGNCAACVNGMGVNRTRGMGSVQMDIEWGRSLPEEIVQHTGYSANATRLDYRLTLKEPLILKSIDGGQIKTESYIEGAKILGYIAEHCDDFIGFMDRGDLHVSNAYPTIEGKRSVPAPACCYSKKNTPEEIVDKLAKNYQSCEDQLNGLGDCFIADEHGTKMKKVGLETEIRYHHSRPNDKSIGRAVKTASESQLYQIQSLSEGQSFSGYITGSKEQIKQVYDMMTDHDHFVLGANRSAEYGKVIIEVTGLSETADSSKKASEFVLKLNAPVILYNENGMYSTNTEDLRKALVRAAGTALTLDLDKCFLKYTSVGGYNVTWHAQKPNIHCFDKGSVLYLTAEKPIDLEKLSVQWIGERTAEGYGEIAAYEPESSSSKIMDTIIQEPEFNDLSFGNTGDQFLNQLTEAHVKGEIEQTARAYAHRDLYDQIKRDKEAVKPLVNVMLLLLKEYRKSGKNLKSYKKSIKDRYYNKSDANKNKKYDLAKSFWRILDTAEQLSDQKTDTSKWSQEKLNAVKALKEGQSLNAADYSYWYLEAFLTEVKYLLRGM